MLNRLASKWNQQLVPQNSGKNRLYSWNVALASELRLYLDQRMTYHDEAQCTSPSNTCHCQAGEALEVTGDTSRVH